MNRIDGISKLRKLTSLSYKLCKEAFDKCEGNISNSLEFLEKCGKNVESPTKSFNNGIIFSYNTNNTCGLFSIKCETDFAAKSRAINDILSKIGTDLCHAHRNSIKSNKLCANKIYHYDTKSELLNRDAIVKHIKMASLTLNEDACIDHSFIIHNTSSVGDEKNNSKQILGVYVHGSHDMKPLDKGKAGTGGAIVDFECQTNNLSLFPEEILQKIGDEISIHLYSVKNLSRDMASSLFQLPIIRVNKFKQLSSEILNNYKQLLREDDQKKLGAIDDEINLSKFIENLSMIGITIRLKRAGILDLNGGNLYNLSNT